MERQLESHGSIRCDIESARTARTILFEPARGWAALRLRDLWQFRDLLVILMMRDVKLRYKQTALGVVWVILQPLIASLIFAVIFGRIRRASVQRRAVSAVRIRGDASLESFRRSAAARGEQPGWRLAADFKSLFPAHGDSGGEFGCRPGRFRRRAGGDDGAAADRAVATDAEYPRPALPGRAAAGDLDWRESVCFRAQRLLPRLHVRAALRHPGMDVRISPPSTPPT